MGKQDVEDRVLRRRQDVQNSFTQPVHATLPQKSSTHRQPPVSRQFPGFWTSAFEN